VGTTSSEGDTPRSEEGETVTQIDIDAAALVRVIREQEALPLTRDQAETLAQTLETSENDEKFLANVVSAVQLMVDQLELSDPPSPTDSID
jgi:hypothetical protein